MVPQEGLPLLAPSQLSQLVVNRAKRTGEGRQRRGGAAVLCMPAGATAAAAATVLIIDPGVATSTSAHRLSVQTLHPRPGLPARPSHPPCLPALPAVPYPLLGENTLVLSDVLCVAPNERGQPCLMCRQAAPRPPPLLPACSKHALHPDIQAM